MPLPPQALDERGLPEVQFPREERNITQPIAIDRVQHCYGLLLEAEMLLEEAGLNDIATLLYHPLGALEERFGLFYSDGLASISASKNALS